MPGEYEDFETIKEKCDHYIVMNYDEVSKQDSEDWDFYAITQCYEDITL